MSKPKISIIIPMLNEGDMFNQLISRLGKALDPVKDSWELILVDDGSQDDTWEKIEKLARSNPTIKGLKFSRNFGHQNALLAGMQASQGDAIITLDGDLQHPPEFIPEMIEAWHQGFKIVEMIRQDNKELSWFKRSSSKAYNFVFSYLSGMPYRYGVTDFRLIDRKIADIIAEVKDPQLFLRGLVYWVGFPRHQICYNAEKRKAGLSKYTFKKMLQFSGASIVSFSTIPLKIGIWLGFLTSLAAFFELIYILVRYLQGDVITGWASILGFTTLMFGVLFFLIGFLGLYLNSVYEILKERPRYLIDKKTGFPDA